MTTVEMDTDRPPFEGSTLARINKAVEIFRDNARRRPPRFVDRRHVPQDGSGAVLSGNETEDLAFNAHTVGLRALSGSTGGMFKPTFNEADTLQLQLAAEGVRRAKM